MAARLRRSVQHATDRDKALPSLGCLGGKSEPTSRHFEDLTEKHGRRRQAKTSEDHEATITPLTSHYTEQSQRGSNPCLHLERVVS